MQDIPQETHHETTRLTQSAQVVLWEIDLTEVGGERYFFCNEQNEKGEPVTWQGRQYQAYPIQGTGFELNGKGSAARPTLTVSNLHGMVTGMAEDLQSLVGGTVVRRKVYARFLDAVNFVNGNSDADPEQEVISRWRIEQCSELSAVSASCGGMVEPCGLAGCRGCIGHVCGRGQYDPGRCGADAGTESQDVHGSQYR